MQKKLKQNLSDDYAQKQENIKLLEGYRHILLEAKEEGLSYAEMLEFLHTFGVNVSLKDLMDCLESLPPATDEIAEKRQKERKKTKDRVIKWTKEQETIFNCKDDLVKVEAVAGSGKTSTLLQFMKRNFDKKMLYVVFNSQMQKEAQSKIQKESIKNCTAHTINAIAYRYTKETLYNNDLSIHKDHEAFSIDIFNNFPELKVYADKAKLYSKVYAHFCNSLHINVEDYINDADTKNFIEAQNENIFDKEFWISASVAREIIKYVYKFQKEKKIVATFGFSLKFFLETSSIITSYDYLLVDESQDLNPVMLAICFKIFDCKKVFVGDSNQQLYAFRGAINALQSNFLSNATKLTLTNSFRCGKNQEDIIKRVIWPFFDFNGSNTSTTTNKIEKNKPYTYLARTRAGVLSYIIEVLDTGKKLYVPSTVDFRIIKDLCCLYNAQNTKEGKLYKICGYENWEDLGIDVINNLIQDFDIINGYNLISTKGAEQILRIVKKIQNAKVTKEEADICVTTVHGFKGLEADQVKLAGDFKYLDDIRNLIRHMEKNPTTFTHSMLKKTKEWLAQEERVLYVAVTRSYGVLEYYC